MKNQTNRFGFTLLEMLTAMAIIAIMLGLLIPAISKIQDTAHTVKQKAQFGAIGIALEAFNTETGDYPPSSYTILGNNNPGGGNNTGYCGAQKLAEAIIGWDGFGFHPQSQWRSDGKANIDKDATPDVIYDTVNGINSSDGSFVQSAADNLNARKGPYLELEKANAVKISALYPSGGPTSIFDLLEGNTFVFADMFPKIKNKATGKKTGMPVLYFRADTTKASMIPSPLKEAPWNTPPAIYNVNENFPFYMYSPEAGGPSPMPKEGRELFYTRIANPNFTSPQRPYRASSFILLSAGSDGLYGTADDVYNIDENEK